MFYCPTNTALTRLFPTFGFQIITERSSLEDLQCRGTDKLSNRWVNNRLWRRNSKVFLCRQSVTLLPCESWHIHFMTGTPLLSRVNCSANSLSISRTA